MRGVGMFFLVMIGTCSFFLALIFLFLTTSGFENNDLFCRLNFSSSERVAGDIHSPRSERERKAPVPAFDGTNQGLEKSAYH